jgi:hypothetical protein
MTDVSRLSTLRYALHTNNTTFSGTPGTLFPLRITDDGASFLPRNRTPIPRPLRSLSGRRYSHIRGVQDLADITVATEFKGVNSNTGANVTDWEAKMEQGYLLASLFGAVAPQTTGVAPTVAASGHTPASGIVAFTSAANVQNGAVIGFATSDGFEVGRVASGGGPTTTSVTLDHPYTGTPTTSATVFRAAVYSVNDSVTQHVHAFFAAEGEDWRRDYFGCAPMSMSLALPNAGLVTMSSVFSPTSFADVAEINPAHAEPVAGSPIVVDAARVWFAGLNVIARDLTLSYSAATQARTASTRTNGKLGGVSSTGDGKTFTIEFSVYVGDGTLAGELQDGSTVTPTLLNDLLGDSSASGAVSATRKLSLQVGSAVGACAYAYMPEADCVVTTQHTDGLTVARVVATGTGALPAILAVL